MIEDSLLLIKPRGDFSKIRKQIGLDKNKKIVAIGPTLYTNDLKSSFKESGYNKVINIDLSYRDNDLLSESFVSQQTQGILSTVSAHKPDYVIFGLVNKPAHLDIWRKVRDELNEKKNGKKAKNYSCSIPPAFNSQR